ncbi:hypothetical protein ACFL0I_03340, partial [Gemmatimonadota bacterium]
MGRSYWLQRFFSAAVVVSFLALAGCKDTTSPPQPASMSGSPSTTISGTVGSSISVTVTVMGDDGSPYAGGVVSFTISSGGGTVSPGSATTSQSGQASASWTLGQIAGAQQLRATLGGLNATFQANAQAGTPASIAATTTFPGTFDPGSTLAQSAVFEVEDQYGNSVQGATVTFSASDGGTANPATTSTNSSGQASTSWTLGDNNGTQTLTATVGSVTPATVTAEAYDPCQDVQTLTIGQTVNGSLSSESCETQAENQLRFLDQYRLTVGTAGAYVFTVTSAFNGPAIHMYDQNFMGGLIANDNDVRYQVFLDAGAAGSSGGGSLMMAKNYRLRVFSDAGGVGSYELTSVASSGDITGCDYWWVTTGIQSNSQSLSATDCIENGFYYDDMLIYLEAGEGISVSQNSTEIDSYLRIYDGGWNLLASNDDSGTGTLN